MAAVIADPPTTASAGARRATAPDSSPAIETRGLTKIYGSLVAVDHLDLTLERGEIFGFLVLSQLG